MTGSVSGFGGQGYIKQEARALSSIEETPGADLSQGQEAQIKMLQSHDYQIKFLAQQMKQAQTGINEANQNPIQQIEQFISDIIILLGGGQLAEGALDFGDLQYILPALGALFGFGDGPFPISLFEAAEKFFLGYVVPGGQFVDVINGIIQAWLGTLGIDPKFIKDIKALITAFGDLFDGISNLLPSLNELFGALGISGGDLGPLGQALAPIMNLFSDLDISKFGNMIEFITDAIDPFITSLTAVINFIDSILAVLGFQGSGGVVNSPLGDTTLPFGNLLSFLADINFGSPDFNPLDAAARFWQLILKETLLPLSASDVIGDDVLPVTLPFTLGGTPDSPVRWWFHNFRNWLPFSDTLASPAFDAVEAAFQFAYDLLKPTGVFAWLDEITGLLPDDLSPQALLDMAQNIINGFRRLDPTGLSGPLAEFAEGIFDSIFGMATKSAILASSVSSLEATVYGDAGTGIVESFNRADEDPIANYTVYKMTAETGGRMAIRTNGLVWSGAFLSANHQTDLIVGNDGRLGSHIQKTTHWLRRKIQSDYLGCAYWIPLRINKPATLADLDGAYLLLDGPSATMSYGFIVNGVSTILTAADDAVFTPYTFVDTEEQRWDSQMGNPDLSDDWLWRVWFNNTEIANFSFDLTTINAGCSALLDSDHDYRGAAMSCGGVFIPPFPAAQVGPTECEIMSHQVPLT